MKKKLIVVILFVLVMLTGCGKEDINSSPSAVAKEMAKRLSEGNYENITELLSVDKSTFIDAQSFKQYLNENNLLIEGNEKYEVIDDGTKVSDKDTTSIVKVRLDENNVLKINTVKKDNKWYVDLGSEEFDKDLIIQVPTGATVKLNGVKLDYKKYAITDEYDRSWVIGGKTYEYVQSMDIYTISSLLKGKYDLQVEHDSIVPFNEQIYSNKPYYNNYMASDDKVVFNSGSDLYAMFARVDSSTESNIKSFVNNYYNDIMKQAEAKMDFSTVTKYFSDTSKVDEYKKAYEEFAEDMVDTYYSTWTTYHSNLKATFSYQDAAHGVYYIGEGKYLVLAKYTMSYTDTKKYKSAYYKNKEDEVNSKEMTKTVIVSISKNSNGSYVIDDGMKVVPSFNGNK